MRPAASILPRRARAKDARAATRRRDIVEAPHTIIHLV